MPDRLPFQCSSSKQSLLLCTWRRGSFVALRWLLAFPPNSFSDAGALSTRMRPIRVYAGSRISAQLLCKNVTPIYTRSLAFALASVFLLYRVLSFV